MLLETIVVEGLVSGVCCLRMDSADGSHPGRNSSSSSSGSGSCRCGSSSSGCSVAVLVRRPRSVDQCRSVLHDERSLSRRRQHQRFVWLSQRAAGVNVSEETAGEVCSAGLRCGAGDWQQGSLQRFGVCCRGIDRPQNLRMLLARKQIKLADFQCKLPRGGRS